MTMPQTKPAKYWPNQITCWLGTPEMLRLERVARQRNVTASTMLAIIVDEWFCVLDARELEEELLLSAEGQLTVDDPDVIDIRDLKDRLIKDNLQPEPNAAGADSPTLVGRESAPAAEDNDLINDALAGVELDASRRPPSTDDAHPTHVRP